MNNRVLRRQLKKFVQISGDDDLAAVFNFLTESARATPSPPEGVTNFIEGFHDFFDAVDKGYNEYDRVLKARETSIEINETEVNRVHGLLKAELQTRDQVLKQLRLILASMTDSSPNSESEELVELVNNVEKLVQNHLERSRDLEIVFNESLKISKSRNFSELGHNLRKCVISLVNTNSCVNIYLNAQKLLLNESDNFFKLSDQDDIEYGASFSLAELSQSGVKIFMINDDEATDPTFLIAVSAKDSELKWEISPTLFQIIKALSASILSTVEIIHNIQKEKVKQRMEIELNTARLVQQTLVPGDFFTVNNQIIFASWYQTASECGGDWWGNYQLKDGRHLILIGDVTGHGMGSALLTAVIKGFCDGIENRSNLNICDFFVELNEQVIKSAISEKWMSMLGIVYDPQHRTLEMVTAGHPLPFLIRTPKNGKPNSQFIDAIINPMLGQNINKLEGNDFQVQRYEVNKGDKLFLFTDGLTEACSPESKEFSESRLLRVINSASADADAIFFRDLIRKKNEDFRKEAPLLDDISLVVAEFI